MEKCNVTVRSHTYVFCFLFFLFLYSNQGSWLCGGTNKPKHDEKQPAICGFSTTILLWLVVLSCLFVFIFRFHIIWIGLRPLLTASVVWSLLMQCLNALCYCITNIAVIIEIECQLVVWSWSLNGSTSSVCPHVYHPTIYIKFAVAADDVIAPWSHTFLFASALNFSNFPTFIGPNCVVYITSWSWS